MRRISPFLMLILFALLLSGLAACGGEEPDPISLTPVAIEYMTFNQASAAVAEEVVIERFEEKYPNIQVTRTPLTFPIERYLTDPTSSPDVMFLWTGSLLNSAMREGQLGNLIDVWDENNLTDAYPQALQQMSFYQGAPYFMPGGHGWSAIYYNREIFARYGLTPPTTWQEFLNLCEILWSNGETPLSIAGSNPFVGGLWFDYLNMRLNGPDFHQRLLNGEEEYTDPRMATVFETMQDLQLRGFFVEDPHTMDDLDSVLSIIRGDSPNPIVRRKAVMTLASNFVMSDLPPVFQEELGFFRFPPMDQAMPVGEVGITFGFIVPANAPNPLQANALAGFFGSLESAQLLTQQSEVQATWVPAHKEYDRDLYGQTIQQAEGLVAEADYFGPPMILALPQSMGGELGRVLNRLLRQQGEIPDWQLQLEEARQQAIRNGEYPDPLR